jgi:hypothetical protein
MCWPIPRPTYARDIKHCVNMAGGVGGGCTYSIYLEHQQQCLVKTILCHRVSNLCQCMHHAILSLMHVIQPHSIDVALHYMLLGGAAAYIITVNFACRCYWCCYCSLHALPLHLML